MSRQELISHTIVNQLAIDLAKCKELTMITAIGPTGEPTLSYVLWTKTALNVMVKDNFTSLEEAWNKYFIS